MISLYLDEDSESQDLAAALRRAGLTVLRTSDAGNQGKSDPLQLSFATSIGYCIVTANAKDYRPLHREWAEAGMIHSGVVIRFQRVGLREEIRRLTRLATSLTGEDMAGQVHFLSQWKA